MAHTQSGRTPAKKAAALFGFGTAGCAGDDAPDGPKPSIGTEVSGLSLAAALEGIKNDTARTDGAYTITLSADEPAAGPFILEYPGRTVSITLKGGKTVTLKEAEKEKEDYSGQWVAPPPFALFAIKEDVTVTLEDITLEGRAGVSSNTSSLIRVEAGGRLVMKEGSVVRNNVNYSDAKGGGVYVASSGAFTMTGGTISGNTTGGYGNGGGVYVDTGGVFALTGGTISGNTARGDYSRGGGVYVNTGVVFTMNGGTISGNTASSPSAGGGSVYAGTFTMNGGTISGNTANCDYFYESGGGGVYASKAVTITAGEISGNTVKSGKSTHSSSSYGGGVYAETTVTIKGGVIRGNMASIGDSTASSRSIYGGGVSAEDGYGRGAVIMEGGEISGNTVTGDGACYGGGVYTVDFTMNAGLINGNTANNDGGGVHASNTTMTGVLFTGMSPTTRILTSV